MTGVLLVDWLGRGGIAQTTDAWRRVITDHGDRPPAVITRAGQELSCAPGTGVAPLRVGGRLAWHTAVVAEALRFIATRRPEVVVVQNYLVPALESRVLQHARRSGARTILVMHNRRPHQRLTGSTLGLDKLIASADVVLAHSEHVAADLPGSDVRVVPLPRPDILLESRPWREIGPSHPRSVLQFGVMNRGYKGARLLSELAGSSLGDASFRLCGAGASASVAHRPPQRLEVRDGFLSGGDLVTEIRRSSVVVLPYRAASQSAAVVLTQALGVPVVASAVGGIPEQIEDGVDGFLIPPSAPVEAWVSCLETVFEADRAAIGDAARLRIDSAHERFTAGVLEVASV